LTCKWKQLRVNAHLDCKYFTFWRVALTWQNKYDNWVSYHNSVMHSGRRNHEKYQNHEHRNFGEKHARSMRCSERGMWQTQKTREIARYDERDEPEKGNKGKESMSISMEKRRGSLKAQ